MTRVVPYDFSIPRTGYGYREKWAIMGFQVTSPTEKWGTPQGQPSTPISEQHLGPLGVKCWWSAEDFSNNLWSREFCTPALTLLSCLFILGICGRVAILPCVCTAHDRAGHSPRQGSQTVQLCINKQLFQVPKTVGVTYIITLYQVLTKCRSLLIQFFMLLCQFL